jgi:hypothetical protein
MAAAAVDLTASSAPLHFSTDPTLTLLENFAARGADQPIYLGKDHPYLTIFASSCRPILPASPANINLVCTPWLKALENLLSLSTCRDAGIGYKLGTHAPSPEALDARLTAGITHGIPVSAHTALEFSKLARTVVRDHPADFELSPLDFSPLERRHQPQQPLAPGQIADRPDWWVEDLPWSMCSDELPTLHALAEFIKYCGNFFRAIDRGPDSRFRIMADYTITRLQTEDPEFTTMPMIFIGESVLLAFKNSTWDQALDTPFSTHREAYTDLADRFTMWSTASSASAKATVLKRRFSAILNSKSFTHLKVLCSAAAQAPAFDEVARLVPAALNTETSTAPMSFATMTAIEKFLSTTSTVWNRPAVLNKDYSPDSSLSGIISGILLDHELSVQGSAAALTRKELQAVAATPGSGAQAGAISQQGYSKDVYQELIVKLREREHVVLRETLLNLKDQGSTDYILVYDTIMGSGCEIFIKFMLEYIKTVPHEAVFRWLSPFREHYIDWAGIRLCCNPGVIPTSKQATFGREIRTTILKNRAAKFSSIDVLKDVWNPLRRHTANMRLPPPVTDSMIVADGFLLIVYKDLGNKLASIVGHTLVTASLAVSNSFVAGVDALAAFLQQGQSLQDEMLENHRAKGIAFIKGLISEQSFRFQSFAKSDDPAAGFPSPYISQHSNAVTDKNHDLTCLADMQSAAEYSPAVLRLADMERKYEEVLRRLNSSQAPRTPQPKGAQAEAAQPRAHPKRPGPQGAPAGAKHPRVGDNADPAAVDIGADGKNLTFIDTATEFGLGAKKVLKTLLAEAAGCGENDRCWALTFSTRPWPDKLRMCNKPGQPGHESHDSAQHQFTPMTMLRCRRVASK